MLVWTGGATALPVAAQAAVQVRQPDRAPLAYTPQHLTTMRFPYSTTDPSLDAFDSLPRLPLRLRVNSQAIEVMGLVDSGATVNVLPYEVGQQLGMLWEGRRAKIRLAGTLGQQSAMPVFMLAEIADFASVRLAFAWVQSPNVPLILARTHFFMEFEVCFYRPSLEFDVTPKVSI